ncbi:MAG: recombinase family protein [Rickettsiales bacterium]
MKILQQAGCNQIFTDDGVSAVNTERTGLEQALNALKPHDTLVVWKLDRLARSLTYLCDVLDTLSAKNISFVSISDGIDTSTNSGKMLAQILGVVGEFERNINIERTMLGLNKARNAGKHLGRPFKLSECRIRCAHRLITQKGRHIDDAARLCRVSPLTLRRGFKRLGLE